MTASCDKPEHTGLLPLQHLVEHLRWGCTGQAQQAWLLEAVFAEHAHQLAERQRALPLSGVEAGIRDALANHIDPKVEPGAPPDVEVRFADGPTVRVAGQTVTTDAATGLIVVEGFLRTWTEIPQSGDTVRLAYLGIPGRGALADVTASVAVSTRLGVPNIRIHTTIDPQETP